MAAIGRSDIVFGIGPAGTGTTYLAVAMATQMLGEGRVGRIVPSRPAVEAAGESPGFLPGTMEDKIEPYLLPIYDVLNERIGRVVMCEMLADERI